MRERKHQLCLFFLLVFSLKASAQIHDSIRSKYFIQHDQLGKLDKQFENQLKNMQLVHPIKYFELSLEQSQQGYLNEASIATYLGLIKYSIYNQTNPEYEVTADGAAFSSLLSASFQPLSDFLSSNLDNHAFVLKKALDIQTLDKKYFFAPESSDSISDLIVKSLGEYQKELELSPETYISTHENLTLYNIDLKELYKDIPFEEEEKIQVELTSDDTKRKKSGDYPASFIHLDRNYIIKGEPTFLRIVAHGYGDTYVECSNCKIYPKDNPLSYELIADTVGTCEVTVYGVGPTRKGCLGRYYYQVLEKPDIFLYLGRTISGRTLVGDNYELSCDELNYFRFENYKSSYTINSWEMTIEGVRLKGTGNKLSTAAINLIQNGHPEDLVIINAKVSGPKNEVFSVKGIFLR